MNFVNSKLTSTSSFPFPCTSFPPITFDFGIVNNPFATTIIGDRLTTYNSTNQLLHHMSHALVDMYACRSCEDKL
jgi:hypothetical protein